MYPNILRHPRPLPIPKKVELAMALVSVQKNLSSYIKKPPNM
ncbi:hypothetical protein [Halobacillus shinanisalinarum]|nr:hypothetical protein [Halobacillus shinanisalinarum]